MESRDDLQANIETYGRALWRAVERHAPGALSPEHWQTRLFDSAMQDRALKAALFHLVDVLPVLPDQSTIAEHARAHLLREVSGTTRWSRRARWLARQRWLERPLARMLTTQTRLLGKRFILGETVEKSLGSLRKIHDEGLAFTVDLLGEATVSEQESAEYAKKYGELIEALGRIGKEWADRTGIHRNHFGPIPIGNVSVKVSALDPRLDVVDCAGSASRLAERLAPLFSLCKANQVFINLDMEQWALHEVTLRAFEQVIIRPELADYPHMGIVVQAYLRDSAEDVERLRAIAQQRGTPITVRLVKGAYWDYEVAHARQYGFSCPVFEKKFETDAQFERLTVMLVEAASDLSPAFASHNLRSIAHAVIQARAHGLSDRDFEIQMLYGAARPERDAIRDEGFRVRLYAPVGAILPGMAYLVRRLLENSANEGFLRLAYQKNVDIDRLMLPPVEAA